MASSNSNSNSSTRKVDNEEETHEMELSQQNADSTVDRFILDNPVPGVAPGTVSAPRLHNPVVIPQRRPGNKERGFAEAYAPDLEAFGIDEESFLAFIQATNKAVQASKWLYAIQVAAIGTGFIPNHIALGVSAAVQVIAGVVAKTETRWKTNSFMDRMNDNFFRPRGLYCLIMSYSPVITDNKPKPDPAKSMSYHESSPSASGLTARVKRNLRNPSAGVSQGEESLPESVARLVYPDMPNASSSEEANIKRKVFSRLNNYFDRRAQARYAAESKGDVLSSAPQTPFSNRYLDPNHPASNGGLLGLLSGGKLTPDTAKQRESVQSAMAAQEQAVQDQHSAQMANLDLVLQGLGLTPEQKRDYIQQYENAHELQLQQFKQQSELLKHGHRRITRNILYLMIVNMPTEREMKAARGQETAPGYEGTINDVTITNVNVD